MTSIGHRTVFVHSRRLVAGRNGHVPTCGHMTPLAVIWQMWLFNDFGTTSVWLPNCITDDL